MLLDGGWTYGDRLHGSDPLYQSATGIALSSIILMQVGNVIGRRRDDTFGLDAGLWRNKLLILGIIIEVVFSWAILYATPVQRMLGIGPST